MNESVDSEDDFDSDTERGARNPQASHDNDFDDAGEDEEDDSTTGSPANKQQQAKIQMQKPVDVILVTFPW